MCRDPLVELSVGEGSGGGCQRCAGVWVDEVGLAEVRARHFATILESFKPRPTPKRARGSLGCPICQRPMLITEVASAEVDACPGHGTWFDAGELELFAHAIAVARNRAAIGEAPRVIGIVAPAGDTRRKVDSLNAELSRSVRHIEQMIWIEQQLERSR